MSALTSKFGPYHHAEGFKAAKSFETGGEPRRFTLILAGAEERGIIASEANGIVVLDDDNRSVVLDRHLCAGSGYSGPSAAQRSEFERVKAMDWPAFAAFCASNPRYRGGMPDARSPTPDEGRAPVSDRVVFPPGAKVVAEGCPYDFGLSTRREIVGFLQAHDMHEADSHDAALSWNIKVRSFDQTGRGDPGEAAGLDERHDLRWTKLVEADQENAIFDEACQAGLMQYLDGEFNTYLDDEVDAKFTQSGRSGGHLCLTELDGRKLVFQDRVDMHRWLEDEDRCEDRMLVAIYKAVVTLDHDLRNPTSIIDHQYAFIRSQREDEWNEAFRALPADARAEIERVEAEGARFFTVDDEWFAADPEGDEEHGPFDSQVEAARGFAAEARAGDPAPGR